MDNTILIAMTEAQPRLENVEGLEQKLKVAMELTNNHWLIADEEKQFKAAIGAVLENYGIDTMEYKYLAHELKQLNKIGAMIDASQSGLSVNIESLDDEYDRPEGYKPLGLVQMWKEITKEWT